MLFSRVIAVMLLVNTCVFDSCCQTTLLRWTILQSEDERLSLTDFYERVSFCTLHKVVCTVAVVTVDVEFVYFIHDHNDIHSNE